jgi:hypothetical protein
MNFRRTSCHDINCIEVELGPYSLTLTESFGPRVLRFGLTGQESVFGEHPGAAVETGYGTWRPLGGHRLWVAPEAKPTSYAPDDKPIELEEDDDAIELIAPTDAAGFRKQMSILCTDSEVLTLRHTVTNETDREQRIAAWCLTIMKGGGTAYLPMEPYKSHAEELLPARQLILWHYTDLTDPRWTLGKKLVSLRVDEQYGHPQKIGASNRQGWLGYRIGEFAFLKSFSHEEEEYPDMNSNCEIYTGGSFVELESLSPLRTLQPRDSVKHEEKWVLRSANDWSVTEEAIAERFVEMYLARPESRPAVK